MQNDELHPKVVQYVDSRLKETESRLLDAFPDRDPRGHLDAHKAWIERVDANKKLWAGVREKVVGAIIWSVITTVAIAVWSYLKDNLK
jgi:hypothetical protein